MSTVSITTARMGDASIMTVSGRVDSETAPQLDDALAQLAAGGNNKIVLDLKGVDYMSSAGLRAIVKAAQAAQKAGGDFRLAAVSNAVEVVLRTVGMLQMFKLYTSSGEAANF
ncbi:MAG: STAS domain-containing protein [Chloroflexi bacterium]|nr:STAS domain-containing protein [Chloroflexota bacterium]